MYTYSKDDIRTRIRDARYYAQRAEEHYDAGEWAESRTASALSLANAQAARVQMEYNDREY